MHFDIFNLFPTPVLKANIDRKFTKRELNFVEKQKSKCVKNVGNTNTKDSYILNNKPFENIKTFLNNCCNEYLNTIICPKEKNINLYITQSWLNYTTENQSHHHHSPPNSVVSGVLYFDCDKEKDKITFSSPLNAKQIQPEIGNYNIWNSDRWWLDLQTGEILLFPSSLMHQVETKVGTNTRISLAFNTFYKGSLGSDAELTQLIL